MLLFLHRRIHIWKSTYNNSNFLMQDFQRLNYLWPHYKNRYSPDICNFFADFGGKSRFYICLRLWISIDQWIVHIEIGIWNLHGCNHYGFVQVGETILQAGFRYRNKRVVLLQIIYDKPTVHTSLRINDGIITLGWLLNISWLFTFLHCFNRVLKWSRMI